MTDDHDYRRAEDQRTNRIEEMVRETRDMTVRLHEALIVAKIPQRVGSLEESRAELKENVIVAKIPQRVSALEEARSEIKGGWKVLMAAGAVGGFLMKCLDAALNGHK